ncbi:MAG TPA: fasciclin domain-containing protein [Chitinophagaceae bacterium]|nr:fasciclin domain-containing protein [Chitinophagaceae bacterium]
MSTIMQIANADRHLSILSKGLKSSGLEDALNENGPFTMLAPVNLAFGNLTPASWEELLKPANKVRLSDLLSYHIINEKRLLKDFINGQKLTTINGRELKVTVKDGEVSINGAKILSRDRQGSNGVVHSVDAVNIPPNPLHKVD